MSASRQLIDTIIQEQNKVLLKQISDTYNLDYNVLLKKYNTPSFFSVTPSPCSSKIELRVKK